MGYYIKYQMKETKDCVHYLMGNNRYHKPCFSFKKENALILPTKEQAEKWLEYLGEPEKDFEFVIVKERKK